MKKTLTFRPHPFLSDNNIINLMNKEIGNLNEFSITNFKFWNLINMIFLKKKADYILLHWPESLWRSKNILFLLLKILLFFCVFLISKLKGYKWAWFVHNIIPHTDVSSEKIEILMRKFIAKNFDLTIFLNKVSEKNFTNQISKIKKKFVHLHHPIYSNINFVKSQFDEKILRDQENLKENNTINLLCLNLFSRNKKNGEKFLDFWKKNYLHDNCLKLTVTGAKKNYSEKNINFIKGYIHYDQMEVLIKKNDVLVVTQKEITNSGQLFLALTYSIRLFGWKNDFFLNNNINNICILFNNLFSSDEFKKNLEEIKNRNFFKLQDKKNYFSMLEKLDMKSFGYKFKNIELWK